jgi:signal transduction histidine kinase
MKNLADANNHKVFFNFDESLFLKCDVKILPTALLNLYSNSCKYTARGGKIYIELSENSHETRIDIIDNGYGIPKEIQDKVFIRFFQADTSKNEAVGGEVLCHIW